MVSGQSCEEILDQDCAFTADTVQDNVVALDSGSGVDVAMPCTLEFSDPSVNPEEPGKHDNHTHQGDFLFTDNYNNHISFKTNNILNLLVNSQQHPVAFIRLLPQYY